jgi:hypothetical protein
MSNMLSIPILLPGRLAFDRPTSMNSKIGRIFKRVSFMHDQIQTAGLRAQQAVPSPMYVCRQTSAADIGYVRIVDMGTNSGVLALHSQLAALATIRCNSLFI